MRRFFISVVFVSLLPMQAFASFGFDNVIEHARQLAAQPYKEPEQIPRFMQDLTYNQYQDIRFNPDKSLWQDTKSKFQVMLVPPGLFYKHSVRLNVVSGNKSKPLAFDKDNFVFTDTELQKLVPPDLGHAGFKLTYPFNTPNVANQFLVFAGASYLRGVGKENAFGISARGIAVDTGLPSGEEFPSFVEFWLVKPNPKAKEMMLYGLLDGPSLSGAYQFRVMPGDATKMDVRAVLFPRNNMKMLGIAPLTSMFYYGENTSRPRGEWRGEVHDSDGLLIENGDSGEWLWRPLLNPTTLTMDYFATNNVRGFGLLQRDAHFGNFGDLGANYHKRPSTWVTPENGWGPGDVVLVQLPTPEETNDNIVAFWTPRQAPMPNTPYYIGYSLSFGNANIPKEKMGRAINTYIGDGNMIGGGHVKGAYRVIVDFTGGDLARTPADAAVTATVTAQEQGEILEQYVEYNAPMKAWRLSMLTKPAEARPLDVRAFLTLNDKALTETWTYRLPAKNDILGEIE